MRDARTPSAFASHFAPDVPADAIEAWRRSLEAENDPSGFEFLDNDGCNRMTWGELVIDHSFYVFFTGEPRKVRSIEREGGFGETMAGLFAIEHRERAAPTLFERCQAAL